MSATPTRKKLTNEEKAKQQEERLANLEREREEAKLLKTIYNPKHPSYNKELAATMVLLNLDEKRAHSKKGAAANKPATEYNWSKGESAIGKAKLANWAHLFRNPAPAAEERPKPPKSASRKRKRGQEGGRRRPRLTRRRQRV